MPTGIILDSVAIILGGIIGARYGHHLSEDLKKNLNLIFSLSAFAIGISSLIVMKNMPAVVLAAIIGTIVGVFLKISQHIQNGAVKAQKIIANFLSVKKSSLSEEMFLNQIVTVIVLFSAAATGIYGSLDLGMTGDNTILIVKAILDFFTAIIFAANLGIIVSVISIPQFIVCIVLFYSAQFIMPLTNADMINDFKACAGFIMLANGFRIANIKMFPAAELLPALVLVFPFSYVWVQYILPLL